MTKIETGRVESPRSGVAADASPKLDGRTKELIAVGASVAANCLPCLEYHRGAALGAGASPEQIAEAVAMGRVVRKGAASKMDAFVAELAGKAHAAPAKADSACGCGS